jgi:hypothetical protein
MPITDERIKQLKAEHPDKDLRLLANEDVDMEIVVRLPTGGEWSQFRAMQADETKKPHALRKLLLDCIVEPPRAEFIATLDVLPALAETFGSELLTVAGLSRATTSRKL